MKSLLFLLIFPCCCYAQLKTDSSRHHKDETHAREAIEDALLNPSICFNGDTLIPDKVTAIRYAEFILFKTYGEGQIVSERPYNIYRYHGFWYVDGTLKEETGGVFEIIFSSNNGQIIKLCHGK